MFTFFHFLSKIFILFTEEYLKNPYQLTKFFSFFWNISLDDLNESSLFHQKLELSKETKKICTGLTTFDINNLVLNELISKKLYNLSLSDPLFFKKLTSIFTLSIFQSQYDSDFLIILKKPGDLYYLYYKLRNDNKIDLLKKWTDFLEEMRVKSAQKYDFFDEIGKLSNMSISDIYKNPDVINRILSKRTKKILFLYLQNDVLASFELIKDFDNISIKELPFKEDLMRYIVSDQGKLLEKYFKSLRKESNELLFLKTSLVILKILNTFMTNSCYLADRKSLEFSVNFLFWRVAKIILFFRNGAMAHVILNYVIFIFDQIFIFNKIKSFKEDFGLNFLFLLASFLVVFQRNISQTLNKAIILEAKKKILLIIEKILQNIENPIVFLKNNFFLESLLDSSLMNNLFEKARSLDSKSKSTPLKIDAILAIIYENKHFPEKIIIILHFLKSYLQKVYLDSECFTPEFKRALFIALLKVSNAKDFKRLSLKERFSNNNLLHQEKTILLMECFGIIGARPPATNEVSIQPEDFSFDKNLSSMDLAIKILVCSILFFLGNFWNFTKIIIFIINRNISRKI